jgi:hypothetical protein
MSYYKVTNHDEYLCDSDSDKDSIPAPMGVGATLKVLDTGLNYIWNGSRWVEDLSLYVALKEAIGDNY